MLEAVLYQIDISDGGGGEGGEGKCGPGYGLIRLCVGRNELPQDDELYAKIEEAMSTRNPFQKPPTPSPSNEDQN